MTTDIRDMIAAVETITGDDGTGDLGIIVRQALRDDPAATAEDIAAIVVDARADARRDRDGASSLTEQMIRSIVGSRCHIERGNAPGEWVVDSTACWTIEDVQRVREARDAS